MSKIYIVTDMEGVAGINSWEECSPRKADRLRYEHCRHLLTMEVNAAVKGALEGGAQDVVVIDGHGGGMNFIPGELVAGARYILGRRKPKPLMGLSSDFDGMILLGYHPMQGTPEALLAHTQNPAEWKGYFVNGRETGEIGQCLMIAGHHNVPLWLITGGAAACSEAKDFVGDDLPVLVVKQDLSYESSLSLAPEEACEKIKQTVCRVVSSPPKTRPYLVEKPIKIRLEFNRKLFADGSGISPEYRIDETTFEIEVQQQDQTLPRSWPGFAG